MFLDWLHDSPHMSFEDAHWVVWDNYPNDFEAFWGLRSEACPEYLEADDWEEYRRLYQLATKLGQGVVRLVRPRRLPERALTGLGELRREADHDEQLLRDVLEKVRDHGAEDLAEQIRDLIVYGTVGGARAKATFFDNAMQIVAHEHFGYDLDGYAERMIQLVGHLTRTENSRTQAFLARVAECYIRGMDPEFAVMARAVMQSALERVLPEEDARNLVREHEGGRLGLAGHIDAAITAGMVDDEVHEAMKRIKDAGDDAAHALPQLAPRASILIEDLSNVLRHLEEYPDAE